MVLGELWSKVLYTILGSRSLRLGTGVLSAVLVVEMRDRMRLHSKGQGATPVVPYSYICRGKSQEKAERASKELTGDSCTRN